MTTDITALSNLDVVLAGEQSPSGLRGLEELAEAAKRYAQTHEQKVAATVAKLKIARRGGQVLKQMADTGQRKTRATAARKSSPGSGDDPATLDDLGLTYNRSSRWQAVGNMTDSAFNELVAAVQSADPDSDLGVIVMGGLKASTSNEWYTPAKYIEAARRLMGGIDLDPASSELANRTVRADRIWTQQDDGLARPWSGRVWMNPPYGKWSGLFVSKLVNEYDDGNVTAAVVLLNAYGFDAAWFQPLWRFPVCFTDHRIEFTSPHRPSGGPANGNVFVYLGQDELGFVEHFGGFGQIVRAWPETA